MANNKIKQEVKNFFEIDIRKEEEEIKRIEAGELSDEEVDTYTKEILRHMAGEGLPLDSNYDGKLAGTMGAFLEKHTGKALRARLDSRPKKMVRELVEAIYFELKKRPLEARSDIVREVLLYLQRGAEEGRIGNEFSGIVIPTIIVDPNYVR